MNEFTIRDLENLTGIKAHTIRIWEHRYSFLKPQRTVTNIRHYSNEELKTILNIALLNKYGYKISHIDKMSAQELNDKVLELTHPDAVQERLIHEMVRNTIDMDIDAFESVLDDFIFSKGIDKTITQAIFPFLERIGMLWMTSYVHPAQEHLISNIVRQKLCVGIESASAAKTVNKLIMLFLPEGEHHEIGLLYASYLLKIRGAKQLYLGADVPFDELVYVANIRKPDYLYTHLTCAPRNFKLDKYLTAYSEQDLRIPLIISGRQASTSLNKFYPAVQPKTSLPEVQEFITTL